MTADAAAWKAWTTVTPVVVAPAGRQRFVRVALPLRVDPGPDGAYSDLRVVDEHDTETPYALDPPRRGFVPARLVRMHGTRFVPHRYTEAVLDLGARPLADTVILAIDLSQRPTYFEHVSIDASDDRRTWRTVRRDAIVYRVAEDDGRGNQTIAFPVTRSRWLRLRIADPHEPFPIVDAHVDRTERQPPSLEPVAPSATETDPATHRQRWTFDGHGVALRPSAVTFAGARTTFARHAAVEWNEDGAEWTQAADGDITRFADGGAQTSFAFPESSAPRWRVAVDNGNDAPVPGLRPALLVRRHHVVFAAAPGARYRLLSGNDVARAPAYDLGARLAHGDWRAEPAATGPTVANPAYADQRPVTERTPGLLTAVLLAVAAALGALALHTVRTAKRA